MHGDGVPPGLVQTLPRRPPLAVLVAISTMQPFALNVLAPATPSLTRTLQTDYATIQLTLSVYLVAVAATQLFVGPISDRVGRRPCILAGIVLFLAGSLIGAAADGVATLLAARIVQAVGGGTCFALSRAVVRDTAGRDEAASLIGYITMSMVVAPMVAPLVGGLLDARFGWRSIFVACAVLALGVGLATAWLLSETAPGGGAGSLGAVLRAFPEMIRDRVFLGFTLALSFTTSSFFAFIAGAPFIMVEVMGQAPDVYGLYFVLIAGGYMVGNFVSGRYGQRLGAARLVALGTGASLLSTSLALLAAALDPWTPTALFVPLILNSVGNGLTIPGATAAALSARPQLAGTAAGISGATQLGFGALASVLAGTLVTLWPPSLVVIMLGFAAAGLVAGRLAR